MRPNFSPIFVGLPGIWHSGTTDSRLRMRNLSGWFTRPSGTVRLSGGPDGQGRWGASRPGRAQGLEALHLPSPFRMHAQFPGVGGRVSSRYQDLPPSGLSLLTPPDEPYTGQCRNADVLLAHR